MKFYGAITKTEEMDDGTIKVWGTASSEAIDSDGEIITAEAMKAAIPDYMKFGGTGAVREMHKAAAAGTTFEIEVLDDGTTSIGTHIVDPVAVKKVKTGVYKGFSIGGKVTSRDELKKTTVTGLKLVEISLVDRPANQDAIFSLVKFEEGEEHDIKKYAGEQIYDASQALEALRAVFYLYSKELSETVENPDQVEALKSVIDNLKAFIASEIKEPDNSADAGFIAYAATTDDLHKAGAEISAKNKKTAQAIHDHAVSLGASCTPDAEKAEGSDDLQKVQPERDDLQKAYDTHTAALESISKACGEAGCIEGGLIPDFIKGLKEELDTIKAKPAPAKAVLSTIAIGKTADSVGSDLTQYDDCVVKNADGTVNEAASLMKATRRGLA